jgi:hypothetical protein
MTMLEDRVRRAIHAKADEIPSGPPPPLRLPARRPRPAWGRLSARLSGRRGLSLAALIAAALAVAAVIVAVFAVAGAIHLGAPTRPRPVVATSTPPRYYVALILGSGYGKPVKIGTVGASSLLPSDAVVRVTATGQAVATIAPPRPYQQFDAVTGAADDRTFVLAAVRSGWAGTKFYLLRLGPGGHPGRLIPLRIPPPLTTNVTDLALSPDGTRLAIEGGAGKPSLFVFDLATGATRAWLPEGIGTDATAGTQNSLSWTADGRTLALIFWGDPGGGGVRLLDVAARGQNLLTDSRLAVGQPKNAPHGYWTQARITPDGHTIVAIRYRAGHAAQQLAEFSARTGKVLLVLGDNRFFDGGPEKVEWASPSGNVLIVSGARYGPTIAHGPFPKAGAGVFRDGRYTPLPWSSHTFAAAW